MVQMNFDPYSVEGDSTFEVLPAGDYEVIITHIEQKKAQSGSDYLAFEFTVDGPSHANRLIWENLNLWHVKEKVVGIAQRALRDICLCSGLEGALTDTDQLIGKRLVLQLGIKKDPQHGDQNKVKRYKSAGDSTSFNPPGGHQQQPQSYGGSQQQQMQGPPPSQPAPPQPPQHPQQAQAQNYQTHQPTDQPAQPMWAR